jgi:iron complex outermembrane receptor protein
MRNSYLISILFFLFLSSAISAQIRLNGSVVDSATHTPIKDAIIYIPDLRIVATTNDAGLYSFSNIPLGSYLLEIKYLGYASQTKEVIIKETTVANFVLLRSNMEAKEVIVTGVSTATEQASDPIPVSIINKTDLLQNSGTNITDAISIAPGVSQITVGPAISKPVIRGLGYNRVITMNDGVRQEGQQWFDEFGEEIDEFSIDRVEILKGPASLRYGSDAMAGVINMLAAPPLPEGQIKANLLLNHQTNNGQLAGSFNVAGNKKGFIWDVRYSHKMAHDYQNKYDGFVANSGYTEDNFKAMAGFTRKWGFTHLTLSSFNQKLGIIEGVRDSASGQFMQHYVVAGPDDSLAIAPASDFKKYNFFPIIHQHIRHYKAVLDNSITIGTGRLNIILGYQENHRQEANDPGQGDTYNNSFLLHTINYDASYVFAERNHFELSAGINGMQQSSRNQGTAFVIPEYNIFDIGGFIIAKKTYNKLSITGGLRYDVRLLNGLAMSVDSNGARLASPGPEAVPDFTAYKSNFFGLSGSIGAVYDFNTHFYTKANIARGYRAPTAAESGANGIHDGTPFYEIGDHNLKAESSLQADVLFGLNNEDVTVEASVFVNKINNYIFATKLESVLGGDSIRYDPALGFLSGPAFKYVQGDAVLSGGELVFNIHPKAVKWLHFDNSFSYVSAIQSNQPDSGKYLPYTSPPKYRGELKFLLPISKAIKNAYIKVGIEHYFEQNKVYYKFGNETVLNVGLGGDICTHAHTLCSVYIYGMNLADEAYQSNMNRLKYSDVNNVTGRTGVYNMGRNISIKVNIPLDIKK